MSKGVFKTAEGELITLKSNYELADKIETLYTGGKIDVNPSGDHVVLTCGPGVKVVNGETGRVAWHLEEEEDTVTSFAISPDGKHLTSYGNGRESSQLALFVPGINNNGEDGGLLVWGTPIAPFLVIGLRSQLIKQYDWSEKKLLKSWKAHMSPIMAMTFDPSSTLLATGSADSTVKVWDCRRNYCTHNFRGSSGVVHLVKFHPKSLQLITSSSDCKIRLWDLSSNRCLHVLDNHMSIVTGVVVCPDETTLVSVGRDKIINVWDIKEGKSKKTVPVFESLEAVALIPNSASLLFEHNSEGTLIATAGDKGVIKIRDIPSGRCVKEFGSISDPNQGELSEGATPPGYTRLLYQLDHIIAVTVDHNILVYGLPELDVRKQDEKICQILFRQSFLYLLVGFNDEILDIVLVGKDNSQVAVATNSEQARVFNRHSLNCQLLSGHSDIILSMDCSHDGKMLVTSSKDNTIRVWSFTNSDDHFQCVAMGCGHTHSVGAVAFSRHKISFLVSGSKDCTIKLWSLKNLLKHLNDVQCVVRLPVKYTQVAHDKDINSLDISPNDKLIVSGSQDCTAKLWKVDDGSLLGTLRGHRRAVWCAKFSPVDQCVATGSGDGVIKLWAITDFSCVKTFEGHTSSVLKVTFITRGMQLVSSGSDGLLKVWNIRTTECATTLDEHTDKVWAVAGSTDGSLLISGGADSMICFWKDITEKVQQDEVTKQQQLLLREQELSNLLHDKDYVKAVAMAINLDQPMRVYKILTDMLDLNGIEGQFSATIVSLKPDEAETLIRYISKWNTNGKLSRTAQAALSIVLKQHPPSELMKHTDINMTIQGLLPYTERHFQRLSRLQQLSTFVEYTWECMRLPNVASSATVLEERNESTDLPFSSFSLMEVDKNDEVDVIGSPVVEKRIDSPCSVDSVKDLPYATSGELSDIVTLAAADSTTPEVDFDKLKSSLKRKRSQSERSKPKHKKLTPRCRRVSHSVKSVSKLKRTPLKRTRLSLQCSLTSSF